ncbi:MFS general substrate transporter [Setomelanomma holmii]|uniref:MFS general substrate transporter n=1 Tax=Setomelanomma holmii TaxID=210430 RepID=A0A9P4GYS8_9PLEO|nr:MFS general substrate transporter [Setomelanomma holmii]
MDDGFKKPEELVAKEQNVEDLERAVTAQQEGKEKGEEIVAVGTSASERLPFSKARCIALVATVGAAPFLSLLWGRLADVYGRRLIFLWGSVFFTVTSIISPFIPNEIGFDILRGLQGLAAAAMAPTALGILGNTFPAGKAKDIAFGCFGAGAPLGGITGNIFGGVVAEYLNWKWVFWIFGIISAICTVASYFVIPLPPVQPEPSMRNTVDWIGGTLITVGLIILLFALSEGNVVGWSTPWVPTLIVVSMLIILAFGFWQHYLETKTQRRPLMKMSIFKNRKFTWANVLMALFFSSFNNYLIFATYWFQDFQGLSVIQTTLRFLPNGVTGILCALVTGHILSSVRGDYILTFSTICVSMSSLLFAIPIPVDTTYWAYGFPAMVMCVCGADTIFPVLTLFVAKTLPPEDASLGGALITAVGQIGRSVGLAIATAVQTAIIAREKGVSVDEVGNQGHGLQPWDDALKVGIRGTAWFNFGMSVASTAVVLLFIRGIGIIGGKSKR